jgi:hypothetical protein
MIITPDRYGKSVLVNEIAREVFATELDEAKKAGTLGYMARILAQVTLPHSKPEGNEYVRKNGFLTLSILAPSHVGLPYGGIPRVVLSWLTTEAVRTKSREIIDNGHEKFPTDGHENSPRTATGFPQGRP